ncbi:MAG: hypothetical protein AB8B72_11680 [Crocinitomicaceae bacterium]
MNIYLTYDYEIFFGDETGTARKCIVEPTDALRKIAAETGAKMTFFVDVGYIKQLKFHQHFPELKEDLFQIRKQIRNLVAEGHDCQLHIHPHWEDCYHDGKEWIMNVRRYKLVDFSEPDIERIVLEYQSILTDLTKKPVTKFRAGGWCLQPFSKVKNAFLKAGLTIDSTVFDGGKNTIEPYYYDFTDTPKADCWKFEDDICVSDINGSFTEYPISSFQYSIPFFWKLFVLGRLIPSRHKPIGDGYPVPSTGMRTEMLTKGKLLSTSCDGFFVTKLNAVIKNNKSKGFAHTVVIGHPKAMTKFSLRKLKTVIEKQQKQGGRFVVFSQ